MPNTMDEFQAGFEHPPCAICGEPMSRSCFCADLKTWEDAGSWHCQSYEHSYYVNDPKCQEATSKRWQEAIGSNFKALDKRKR